MVKQATNVSQMTQAVLMARKKYPDILGSVVAKLNTPAPYMKQKLDPRTVDQRLLRMTPDDMIALARTDPAAAEAAAARLFELEQKAPPLPPGMGEYEPDA